jgi:hypothetical protein
VEKRDHIPHNSDDDEEIGVGQWISKSAETRFEADKKGVRRRDVRRDIAQPNRLPLDRRK